MRIGIIGAGNVGGTLGRAWAKIGHEVWIYLALKQGHGTGIAYKLLRK